MMTDISALSQVPQPRVIRGLNGQGLATLVRKEAGRFLAVYSQTLLAPVVTTLLYYAIFAVALGQDAPGAGEVRFLAFLAPGLIMMTMGQNAFANTSSSLVLGKVQGNIVDVLMPPLAPGELLAGYLAAGILRGLLVGLAAGLAMAVFAPLPLHSAGHVALYALLGTMLLAGLGIVGGIWSEKFDHIAAVTNFIIMPLTFLSGTFYSTARLPGVWRDIAHCNPFFYMIDGFRYGFTGHADGSLSAGLAVLGAANAAVLALGLWMLRSGYRLKS